MHIRRAGDMTVGPAAFFARKTRRIASIDELSLAILDSVENILLAAHIAPHVRLRIIARRVIETVVLKRTIFRYPLGKSAVEHGHIGFARVVEEEPGTGRAADIAVIVKDDARTVRHAKLAHPLGELLCSRDGLGDAGTGIGKRSQVEKPRAGYMPLPELRLCVPSAVRQVHGRIEDDYVIGTDARGEPFCRNKLVHHPVLARRREAVDVSRGRGPQLGSSCAALRRAGTGRHARHSPRPAR